MEAVGHWDEGCEAMLRLDAAAFDTYAGYIRAAWQTRALEPVTRELVGIAVHAIIVGYALRRRSALAQLQ